MNQRNITVTTRNEFKKMYVELFIKKNPYDWNHSWNINNWTYFYRHDFDDNTSISVQLLEKSL